MQSEAKDAVIRLMREWLAERFDAHPKSMKFMSAAEIFADVFDGVIAKETIVEVAEDLDTWASYFVRDEYQHLPPYDRR